MVILLKKYVCECGKEFDNPQKFNGHKSHCKIHLGSKYEKILANDIINITKATKVRSERIKIKKQQELQKWISEHHTCEKCGKIMTEKFGSGRFCSRSCANSKERSIESRYKTSLSLGSNLNFEQFKERDSINKERSSIKKQSELYDIPPEKFPKIEKEKLSPGWQPRSRKSYAEKFWEKVLQNNNVNYVCEFKIPSPNKRGVYKLDFLIDNKYDIEIDGQRHFTEQGIKHDLIRNNYIESLGYKVFRIKWINPISIKTRMEVNKQIDELFLFIKKKRIY